MTLQEFVVKYDGKYVGDGQCGSLVRAYWNEVDKTSPPSYTNSKDYWFNPVPGYDKVASPLAGDIAIYDGHGSFVEGHSAIVYVDGRVFEQNADPDHSPAHLYNRATTYLLGYLHKQGQGVNVMTEDGVRNVYKAVTAQEPGTSYTEKDIKYWTGRSPTEFGIAMYHFSDNFIVAANKQIAALSKPATALAPNTLYKTP